MVTSRLFGSASRPRLVRSLPWALKLLAFVFGVSSALLLSVSSASADEAGSAGSSDRPNQAEGAETSPAPEQQRRPQPGPEPEAREPEQSEQSASSDGGSSDEAEPMPAEQARAAEPNADKGASEEPHPEDSGSESRSRPQPTEANRRERPETVRDPVVQPRRQERPDRPAWRGSDVPRGHDDRPGGHGLDASRLLAQVSPSQANKSRRPVQRARSQVRESVGVVGEPVEDVVDRSHRQVRDLADQARNVVGGVSDRARDVVRGLRSGIRSVADRAADLDPGIRKLRDSARPEDVQGRARESGLGSRTLEIGAVRPRGGYDPRLRHVWSARGADQVLKRSGTSVYPPGGGCAGDADGTTALGGDLFSGPTPGSPSEEVVLGVSRAFSTSPADRAGGDGGGGHTGRLTEASYVDPTANASTATSPVEFLAPGAPTPPGFSPD